MSHYRKVKIVSDGQLRNTRLLVDGEDAKLPVSDIQVVFGERGVEAVVTLFAPEVEIVLDERQVHFQIQRPGVPKETKRFLGNEPE